MKAWLRINEAPLDELGHVYSMELSWGRRTDVLGTVKVHGSGERFVTGHFHGFDITHWHPLPEPPYDKDKQMKDALVKKREFSERVFYQQYGLRRTPATLRALMAIRQGSVRMGRDSSIIVPRGVGKPLIRKLISRGIAEVYGERKSAVRLTVTGKEMFGNFLAVRLWRGGT